jgi:hypothetical protein
VSHRSRQSLKNSFSKETRSHPAFVHTDCVSPGPTTGEYPEVSPWTGDSVDSLIFRYFVQTGYVLRCSPDGISGYWLKCAVRSRQFPSHYLLVHATLEKGFCGGLAILCGKIQLMIDGDLRPSPDIWEGG